MSRLTFEILFILALIGVNGLLALAEIAVVSARKARLEQRLRAGDERARQALALAEEPAAFLSTVQVGITLVGVLAGAFSGATLAEQIAARLAVIPWLTDYSEAIGIVVVVLLVTYLSIVFGELAPKRLGLQNPEAVASAVAGPMQTISRLAAWPVRFLTWSTDMVMKLLGVQDSEEAPVSEEEIRVMLEQGTQAGVFEAVEQEMIAAVFRLADRRVGSLATPRTEIVWLDLDDPLEENLHKVQNSVHDRFPIAHGSLDNALGILQAKNLLAASLNNQPIELEKLAVEPVLVPESMPVLDVVEKLKQTKTPMALVFDEYGGVLGLVTTSDILGAIVGDIPVAGQDRRPGVVQRDASSWLVDGMLPVDEFKDIFRIRELPGEDRAGYETLGGFLMAGLGRIPKTADVYEWGGYRYEIVDMDGFRVDKALVTRLPLEQKG